MNLNTLVDFGMSVFVMTSDTNKSLVPESIFGLEVNFIDGNAPESLRYAMLFNILNGVAFGGSMGMPQWVLVDCVIHPSMVVGIQGPARLLPKDKRQKTQRKLNSLSRRNPMLTGQLDISGKLKDDELVPLAEFCAVPSFNPECIIGMSMYNVCNGQGDQSIKGLGRMAKALGLAMYRGFGARRQLGITQYDNTALATHTSFGPLEIVHGITPLHTKADRTFIYELEIPSEDELRTICMGGRLAGAGGRAGEAEVVHPNHTDRIREIDARLRAGTHRYQVVSPGYDRTTGGAFIVERSISS